MSIINTMIVVIFVSVVVMILLRVSAGKRPCPHCHTMMPKKTVSCPHCRRSIPLGY